MTWSRRGESKVVPPAPKAEYSTPNGLTLSIVPFDSRARLSIGGCPKVGDRVLEFPVGLREKSFSFKKIGAEDEI